jgi:hypothetical protein
MARHVVSPATCHPERPVCARKLCRSCYRSWWKRRWQERRMEKARRQPCALCGAPCAAAIRPRTYCSTECGRIARDSRPAVPAAGEVLHATRDARLATRLLAEYLARDCRRVHPRGTSRIRGPYVAPWRRGGLYLIRARLPNEFREETTA